MNTAFDLVREYLLQKQSYSSIKNKLPSEDQHTLWDLIRDCDISIIEAIFEYSTFFYICNLNIFESLYSPFYMQLEAEVSSRVVHYITGFSRSAFLPFELMYCIRKSSQESYNLLSNVMASCFIFITINLVNEEHLIISFDELFKNYYEDSSVPVHVSISATIDDIE